MIDRYTVRRLASGSVAVLDTDDRNRVALIGTQDEVNEYLDEYAEYLADAAADAASEVAYARMLEARSDSNSWWGHD